MSTVWVLAHQGGWDEILLVLTPVALFAGLLWLANRRANAQLADRADGDGSEDGRPEDGGAGEGPASASSTPSEADDPPGRRSP